MAAAYPPKIKPEDFKDTLDAAFAGEPREGRVARVASSLGDKNTNTLVPPNHGVMWLHLVSNATGIASKSCGGTTEKDGREDFHYASSVEEVTLEYQINDPRGVILAAKLEIYRRFEAAPFWSRPLTEKEREHGEHSLPFKFDPPANPAAPGAPPVLDAAQFPDDVLTAEHSPYKIRIVTSSKVRPQSPVAWTFAMVLIHEVQLELGKKETLPADAAAIGDLQPGSHRDLFDAFKGVLPEPGKIQRVELLGNLYSTGAAQMKDNTAFISHQTQWDAGPLLPIFAKLPLRQSDDRPVDAPLGLGNVKCLWDWEDVGENTSGLSGAPAVFVTRSINFRKSTTKPTGDNCHTDRGGKRNAGTGADPLFPLQAGYEPIDPLTDAVFPFKVEIASVRKWASLSLPWRKESLAGKTGVLFQPSRMAGDAVKVTCHVAWEKDAAGKLVLDIDTELKDKTTLFASTGTFEIWRKHLLNRYMKKKNFASNIDLGEVQSFYKTAFINLKIDYAAVEFMDAPTYNKAVADHVATLSSTRQPLIDPAVDQHATGDHAVTFRTRTAYHTALRAAKGWTQAQLNTWLGNAGTFAASDNTYQDTLEDVASSILTDICGKYLPGTNGITLCQTVGIHNINDANGKHSGLRGFAGSVPGGGRQKAAFVACAFPDAYAGTKNSLGQTTVHEIGHHLFMPHAPQNVSATDIANAPQPEVHDKDDPICVMSYNRDNGSHWCGFCLLRLRGWDKTNLKNDGAQNAA